MIRNKYEQIKIINYLTSTTLYSKAEAKKLREDFWTSFGKSFPYKWTLYDTKIKDFSFKFLFDTKKARVLLAIEDNNVDTRTFYYNKLLSLQAILTNDYLPKVVYDSHLVLDNGKEISGVYVELEGVSIHNKATWQQTMVFLYDTMLQFEAFWAEYKDIIQEEL